MIQPDAFSAVTSIAAVKNQLVSYSAPGIKRGKQDHFQSRQRIENHSYSFVDCHTLRMAGAEILAEQLLKFCKYRGCRRPG
jgi:hypothetical protein